jgi:outer membrane lipoprotein-sorting protein
MRPFRAAALFILLLLALPGIAHAGERPDATALLERAWDHMRGETSASLVAMDIVRSDWRREMLLRAWTRGRDLSLIRVLEPDKDRNNGTLKKGAQMWTYNPKVNRVIKIPPSMMSQSWMGSDFSNNDLAKADSVLADYTHELLETLEHDGHAAWRIRAVPKPGAPVVWGGQELTVRDDGVLLRQAFFDQDMRPVKILETGEIGVLGGRAFPRVWTMRKAESPDEYTRLEYRELAFGVDLPENVFTLQTLRNPGRLD